MPGQLPASLITQIDALLIARTGQLKSGAIPLRFVGAQQDAGWQRRAAQTIDAAFRMFLPGVMSSPVMEPEPVREILREVHLAGFRTSQELPIKGFLDQFTDAGAEPGPEAQPGTAPRLRRTNSTARLDTPGPPRARRRSGSFALRGAGPAEGGGTSLKPMLDLMKRGIVLRHPAIVEFLHVVVETIQSLNPAARFAYLEHVRRSRSLKKTVYLTYIMDMLVVSMNNSKEFAFELQSHLYRELQGRGIDPFNSFETFRGIMALPNSTLFKGAKTISVFPAMTMYLARRFNNGSPPSDQQIAAVAGHLSWADRKALKLIQESQEGGEDTGLLINMEEAVIADFTAGRRDNAAVGAIYCSRLYGRSQGMGANDGLQSAFLSGWLFPIGLQSMDSAGVSHPFYEAMMADIRKKERIRAGSQALVKNYYSASYDDDWASLYQTWNLAFILGEIGDLDIIAPKLLAPAVLCAKGEQYLFSRVHGLWAAICFLVLKCSDRTQTDEHPPNHEALARLYGAINLEQAWLYQQKRRGAAAGTKEEFLRYWHEAAPNLVGGALGYARLAMHAFFGWTSRMM